MELKIDYDIFFSKLNDNMRNSLSKITEEIRKTNDHYNLKVENSRISGEGCDDDEKLKRKDIDFSFAGSTNENESNLKCKRKKLEKICVPGQNNDDRRLAEREMNFGESISSDVSDAKKSLIYSEVVDHVFDSSEESDASKKCVTEVEGALMNVDLGVSEEEVVSHERRLIFPSRMIRWMATVAKNPTDPLIGMNPDSSVSAFYGNENCWKQVLIAREALFLKKDQFSSAKESSLQEKQKINPTMPDDQIKAAGRPRSCPGYLSEKASEESFFESFSMTTPPETHANRKRRRLRLEAQIDLQPTASIYTSRPMQRIPIGRPFQAEVPEWSGVAPESDPKWLGTRVWPVEKKGQNLLIERDPIGKGRAETCGCPVPGSIECVIFHVVQRRMNLKVELHSAFYTWKFDKMGEECTVSWTIEEEKKFNAVVKNPFALHECFWPQLYKVLPGKSWVEQVNYYFNVFLLRRRAFQNRCTPSDINSDDEDGTEYRLRTKSYDHKASNVCLFNSPSIKAHGDVK